MPSPTPESLGRLSQVEVELDKAFSSNDASAMKRLRADFDAPDLAELRDGVKVIQSAAEKISTGLLEQAVDLLDQAVLRFHDSMRLQVRSRWWHPTQEFKRVCDFVMREGAKLGVGENVGRLAGHILEALRDTSLPYSYRNSASAIEYLAVYVAFSELFSGNEREERLLQLCPESFEQHVKSTAQAIIDAADESLEGDQLCPLSDFGPAAEAAALLQHTGVDESALSKLSERYVTLIGLKPRAADAALVFLNTQLREEEAKKQPSTIEANVRTILKIVRDAETTEGSDPDTAPVVSDYTAVRIAMLLSEPREIRDFLAESALSQFNQMKRDLAQAEGGDWSEEEEQGELEPLGEGPDVDRELSTIELEDWGSYSQANLLAPLVTGSIHAGSFSSFAYDDRALYVRSRAVGLDPGRALAIALGALLDPYEATEPYSIPELVDLLDGFDGRIALRPTREDVSEPFSMAELLLRGVLETARSHDAALAPLRESLARMIENKHLIVTKNVWWSPDLGATLFEQGLDTPEREKAERRAEDISDGNLQVAEEIDSNATQRLLMVLEGSPQAAEPIVGRWLRSIPDRSNLSEPEEVESEA